MKHLSTTGHAAVARTLKNKDELRALRREVLSLTDQCKDQKRQIRHLEDVVRKVLTDYRGWILLPPPELRTHVGRVADPGNFWRQGVDSSQRVLEVFGDDPGGLVLDWGCGPGRTLYWLHAKTAWREAYQGCDVDAEAIAWLRTQGIKCVEVCQDLPPLPYPDQHFVCFSVLTHIPPARHRAWFEEIHRVLKPGGRAYVTVHGDNNMLTTKTFTEEQRAAYFAQGWSWSEREGHYKHAATVTRAFTETALRGLFEVEQYRELGYHSMDDVIIRRV